MAIWQLYEAKNRLSEVIEQANTTGPQIITRYGVERAVVLSAEEYRSLKAGKKKDFIEYLLSGPKFDDFEIERDRDCGRDIDL